MGKMQNVTLAWRVSCRQSVGWRKGLWEGVMEVHAFGQGVVGRARRDVIFLLSEKKIPDSPQGIYGGSVRSCFEIPGETSAFVLDTRGLEAFVVVSVGFRVLMKNVGANEWLFTYCEGFTEFHGCWGKDK